MVRPVAGLPLSIYFAPKTRYYRPHASRQPPRPRRADRPGGCRGERAIENLPRCRTGCRQDVGDAGPGPAPPSRGGGCAVRRGGDARPRRDGGGAGRLARAAAAADRLPRPGAARVRRGRGTGATARAAAGGRAGPHQRTRQPPRQAVGGRGRTGRRRPARVGDAQCPASRIAERRRGAHYQACASPRHCRTRCWTRPTRSN